VAARRHKQLLIVEWPGGEPRNILLQVPNGTLARLSKGGARIPLDAVPKKHLQGFASLPWGSRVTLHEGALKRAVLAGPAKLHPDWYLPIVDLNNRAVAETAANFKGLVQRLREKRGYAVRRGTN
jgi:hypothetical protein